MSLSMWQMVVELSVLVSPAAGMSGLATSSKPAAVASLSCALSEGGRLSSDRQFSDALAGAAHPVGDCHSTLSAVDANIHVVATMQYRY